MPGQCTCNIRQWKAPENPGGNGEKVLLVSIYFCCYSDSPIVGMVLSMMEGTVSRKALPRLEDAVIAGLQLLGNICVEYSSGQAKVWTLMFPSMLW